MADGLVTRCAELLTGVYDCVDRIVLNAYFQLGCSPGGFREWWRRLHGDDSHLDDTHLMRMAGRVARRVRAWARHSGVPLLYCTGQDRKHDLAEQYLRDHPGTGPGVFLVLVARAVAPTWQVRRAVAGHIVELAKKMAYVNHYSFHILDPEWGHVTVKMSGHPPFGAQVILNGHEYVARAAQAGGISLAMDGNCFTAVADPQALAQLADALSQDATVGRLSQVCDRWIYTACLCFGLDSDEQARSGFHYSYSTYQAEYSRNLLFRSGAQMQQLFDLVADRTRARLNVPVLRTLFGAAHRPHRTRTASPPPLSAAIETPTYDLTVLKLNFGPLALKGYTKGERLLRLEAVVHNTKKLGCGRSLDKFPAIIARLAGIVDRFATTLDCVDTSLLPDATLDQLPAPGHLGATRLGGVDLNKPRTRTTLRAVLALAAQPGGFTVADLTAKVNASTGRDDYTTRQAAYDLRKLRAKNLLHKPGRSRRYHVPPQPTRIITALLTLREQVIAPIIAGVHTPRPAQPPTHHTDIDRTLDAIRAHTQTLFTHLGIATAAA